MAKMGAVWDRTAEFLGDRAGALVPLALFALAVPAGISANLSALAGTGGVARGVALVVQLLLWLVSMWGSLAVTALAIGAGGVSEAGQVARRRLLATLIVALTLGIAAAVLGMPMVVMLVAAGYDLNAIGQPNASMQVDPATAMRVGAYSLLWLVIILVLFVRLVVVNPVLLREGGLFGSLGRSWQLTRRHTFRIVGVLILLLVVASVCQLAAQAVFGSVLALVLGGGSGISLATVLTSLVVAAVQSVFMVVFAAFQGKLYVALAGDTEQPDLHPAA
ncbi:hypothetical protein ACNFJ7_08750 [Sphingomonas sp. HT-1]|uniref:hypothetical protein n=1 Tax=unclassified Sphingomonas TaxID=196159 RepID=UPI0003122A24|nr:MULTISPECIES: hypothetical protein [unclassified Sphingomonas]KTF68483.1 hypothetical protein ATB93_13695 [Sphingomonas sp. WG]